MQLRFPKLRRKYIRKTPKEKRPALFTKHFIAGGIAGIVSRTATAPFDRLKIFYQVSTKKQAMLTVLKNMIKEGGVTSLWRGNFMNVIKTTPKSALRFAFYDRIKVLMRGESAEGIKKPDLNSVERFVAGAGAGVISQAITFPLEVLKVRLSLRKTGQFHGISDAVRKIYKTEGIRAFGKGFWPTMVAIVPYSGLDLAGYETIKTKLIDYRGRHLNNRELFFVSCMACLLAQTVTYPLAILCTRMQASTATKDKTKTAREVLYNIWKYEGWMGYYRGLVPNLLKFIPVVSITFVTYEQVIYWLHIGMS